MSLKDDLLTLQGLISTSTSYPPDEYPEGIGTFEDHMDDLLGTWGQIKLQLRSTDSIEYIDTTLNRMIDLYRRGEKALGRDVAWELYNFKVTKLR